MMPAPGRRKLYVLVREDIPPGYQAVQGLHAAVDFQHKHFDRAKKWHDTSNTVVMLGVEDEIHLMKYQYYADNRGLRNVMFWEPDISEYTALCIEPGVISEDLVQDLPLLLRKKPWWRRYF